MSRVMAKNDSSLACFPRVSGDEPASGVGRLLLSRFSPRERG